MKDVLPKSTKENNKANVFTEIGLDKDNNPYFFGISSEIENQDGSEVRVQGLVKMKFKGIYLRLWIFKTVFIISFPGGFKVSRKNRNNLKLVLGISGFRD